MHGGGSRNVTNCLRFWLSEEATDGNLVKTENLIMERKTIYLRMAFLRQKLSHSPLKTCSLSFLWSCTLQLTIYSNDECHVKIVLIYRSPQEGGRAFSTTHHYCAANTSWRWAQDNWDPPKCLIVRKDGLKFRIFIHFPKINYTLYLRKATVLYFRTTDSCIFYESLAWAAA